MFPVDRDGFLLLPVGEQWFGDLCVSLRVFFGAVKLMKFYQCHFTFGSPYDLFCSFGFFKSSRSTAWPLFNV